MAYLYVRMIRDANLWSVGCGKRTMITRQESELKGAKACIKPGQQKRRKRNYKLPQRYKESLAK
jgi:hypothetical protein